MTLAKRPQPQTRSGLLPEAAHLILPKGIGSTGYPATEATCRRIGITFDGWQADLNRCILAKVAGGLYAADTVALSIPRQVGKTFDVAGVVFADSIINPGTTTVWTAHRFKVARESFNEMRAWAKTPKLRAHIDYDEITTAAGNECIPFRNGSRIIFAARERGAIRGFSKVRRLVLDEGQVLTELALADLVPTMNQAVNPQVVLMGTPPKPTDPSEVWTRLRAEALAGDSTGVLYVEFSAPDESDPLDREAWRKANPSYPRRTSARAILRMHKLLSEDDFRREALGIWDDSSFAGIDLERWRELTDEDARMDLVSAFALEVSIDRSGASIAAAGPSGDRLLVELVDPLVSPTRAASRCGELARKHGCWTVALDANSPSGNLMADLEDEGLSVVPFSTKDVASACASMVDAIKAGTVVRGPQIQLDTSAAMVRKRPLGDGAFAFGRKKSTGDIRDFNAVTFARHAAVEHEGLRPDDVYIGGI